MTNLNNRNQLSLLEAKRKETVTLSIINIKHELLDRDRDRERRVTKVPTNPSPTITNYYAINNTIDTHNQII